MDLSELAAYAEEKFNIREQFKWSDFPSFSVLAAPYSGKWAALLMRQSDPATGKISQRCDIKCGIEKLNELNEPYLSQPFRMKGPNWLGVSFDDRTKPEVVFRLFDQAVYAGEQSGYTLIIDNSESNTGEQYKETALSAPSRSFYSPDTNPDIPEKIREMMRLYKYGDNSFNQKCKNFYTQGKFMEDYAEDFPWKGDFRHYFPTYHDLNAEQLRGYFSWRKNARKGVYQHIPVSLAYIYIYELLNGIGTSSAEDTLQKLEDFENGFLASGIGDPGIQENLHRWMYEFSIVNAIPAETTRKYIDQDIPCKDNAILNLKEPQNHTDNEVFDSICVFSGEKLRLSPVIAKFESKGIHLFAEVWRYASQFYSYKGQTLFTTCFGNQNSFHWYPLSNAVYYWKDPLTEHAEYDLDECRKFICHYGVWLEKKFENLYFQKNRFQALFHEADRLLRSYLKTGHPLKEKPEESWAAPYVQAVIEMDRKTELEAAKPKITIDFGDLDRIRQDALLTRESLLTEEEMNESGTDEIYNIDIQDFSPENAVQENNLPEEETSQQTAPGLPLEPIHIRILQALLLGDSVEMLLKENHLIPSVVTDAINEIFFDEIGDSVLECDDSKISIVEDYKEDIIQLLGGNINE